MKKCNSATVAFLATAALAVSAMNSTAVAGYYVTSPSDTSSSTIVATSTSTAPTDAVSLQLANDASNLYLYVTFNSAVTLPNGLYLAIDSDNNPSTGDNIYGNPAIGSNLGFQNDFPFTQTSTLFNSNANGTTTSGVVTGANFTATASGDSELISISLATSQVDGDTGGYTGVDFPSSFILEA